MTCESRLTMRWQTPGSGPSFGARDDSATARLKPHIVNRVKMTFPSCSSLEKITDLSASARILVHRYGLHRFGSSRAAFRHSGAVVYALVFPMPDVRKKHSLEGAKRGPNSDTEKPTARGGTRSGCAVSGTIRVSF